MNSNPVAASLSMFGECDGWPGIVKLYAPSDGRMSSTARKSTFLAAGGGLYGGTYGGSGGRGAGSSPDTVVSGALTAVLGPASDLRKQVPIAPFNVQPLHCSELAHAQQHSVNDVVLTEAPPFPPCGYPTPCSNPDAEPSQYALAAGQLSQPTNPGGPIGDCCPEASSATIAEIMVVDCTNNNIFFR